MEIVLDSLLDALKDGVLSIPVLLVAYFLMELLERSERFSEAGIQNKTRKTGPLLGSLLGIIPQCGISGAAASLFATGSITVGTMLAVFFATSDEMLPVLLTALAEPNGTVTLPQILSILLIKCLCAVVLGYCADFLLRRVISSGRDIHSFCEREHCECEEEEGSAFLAALKHTVKIAGMLILVGFGLNLLLTLVGPEPVSQLFHLWPVLRECVVALFGLIPNCSVSVILTEFYLEGVLPLSCLFSGLLANAGIGLLVLVRNHKHPKENALIIFTLFVLSALTGCLLSFLPI